MTDNQNDNVLANALLADRKSDRRWRNVRTFVWAFLVLLYAILIFSPSHSSSYSNDSDKGPYVSLIRMNGAIMPGKPFSADHVIPLLNRAFRDKEAKGVVLLINSPGGSAVQASIIHDKIMELKKQFHKRVVVVGVDTLASGAYLISSAADKIYVNKDTLTGSIGVIMGGFGFVDAIHKLGITRRVFTAGTNKDRLDPFRPVTDQDRMKLHKVLNQVHQNFIDDVLQGRRGKLRGNENELFSGDFWTGQQAVRLGLVDGTANLWTVMQKQFNVKHYKLYAPKPSLLQILTNGVESSLHLHLEGEAQGFREQLAA